MIVIVMGVSGCGKSSVGTRLSTVLGGVFAEGDSYHPAANRAKMHSGTPLNDDDRWPWLRAIAVDIDRWRAEGRTAIVSCSALKRAYRDILIGDRPDVFLVFLKGSYDLIYSRLTARRHEYMPIDLLRSQFETLQEPGPDEHPIVIDIVDPVDVIVEKIVAALPKTGG